LTGKGAAFAEVAPNPNIALSGISLALKLASEGVVGPVVDPMEEGSVDGFDDVGKWDCIGMSPKGLLGPAEAIIHAAKILVVAELLNFLVAERTNQVPVFWTVLEFHGCG